MYAIRAHIAYMNYTKNLRRVNILNFFFVVYIALNLYQKVLNYYYEPVVADIFQQLSIAIPDGGWTGTT